MPSIDSIRVRLPWVTLTGVPDRPGRWARVRCLAAMAVHEVVELVAGTRVAHAMGSASRYAIGAPPPPPAKDWPSKSEVFGDFRTLSDRLDALDAQVVQGGALYTVNLVLPYPAEDTFGGWNPTADPCPLFAILAPESIANFANAYILFTDQDAYSNGIWQFTDDPANEPPVFVIDPCDASEHGYTYFGARITVASVLQELYGDIACAVNASTGDMFYSSVGGASPVMFTAYTSDIDVTVPPTQIDGTTPLTDISNGTNLPILLTAQTDPNENGFWFATPNRATRTTLRDKPTTVPDPVVTFVGDDGDLSTNGSWWVNIPGQGWVAY